MLRTAADVQKLIVQIIQLKNLVVRPKSLIAIRETSRPDREY